MSLRNNTMPSSHESTQAEEEATMKEIINSNRMKKSGIPPPKQHSGLIKGARQIQKIRLRWVAEPTSPTEQSDKSFPTTADTVQAEKSLPSKQNDLPSKPLRQLSEIEVLEPVDAEVDSEPFTGAVTASTSVRRVSAIEIGDASHTSQRCPLRQFSEIEVMEPLSDDDDEAGENADWTAYETEVQEVSAGISVVQEERPVEEITPLRQLSEVAIVEPVVCEDELPSGAILDSFRRVSNGEASVNVTVTPQLQELSEIELVEPSVFIETENPLHVHHEAGDALGSIRQVSEVEIVEPQDNSFRHSSQIVNQQHLVDKRDLFLLAVESEREALRQRLSAVQIDEPQVRLAPAVSEEDYMVDTADYNMVDESLSTQSRLSMLPARRGTIQIPNANNLSLIRIEEPMEPATASTAHDLTDGGTERSEDDFLVSPTSVATKKISPALLRGFSLVKVQEPNVSVSTIHELVASAEVAESSFPPFVMEEPKGKIVHSPSMQESGSGKASVVETTKLPGVVAVSPAKQNATDINHDGEILLNDIAIKTGERHRVAAVAPGAVPMSPPRQGMKLPGETSLPDKGLLQEEIAARTGGRRRAAASTRAFPWSPKRQRSKLKEEMRQHDDNLLQEAIAIKTGGRRRLRNTTNSLPGAFARAPRDHRTLNEDMERNDDRLLQDAVATKTGAKHRRNRRRRPTGFANWVRPGAISVPPRATNESLKDAMQRHDDGLLQDAIDIKTGRNHQRRRRLGDYGRRVTGDHGRATTPDEHDSAQPNHVAELSRIRRLRRIRQTPKATGDGKEDAKNAKMEEYNELVRRKQGYAELDDAEWSDEDELECQDLFGEEFDDDDQYPVFTDSVASESLRVDDAGIEAMESGVATVQHDDLSAYVQPYSEWEAERAGKRRRKQRCQLLVAFITLLIVLGAVIGVVVVVTSPGTSDRMQTQGQFPTSAPTVDVMPCVDASSGFHSQRYSILRALVVNNSLGEPNSADMPYSPQRRALCWIAEGDHLQLPAEGSNLPAILQRYTLAVLYFALTTLNQTVGLTTANFLSSANECTWEGIICNVSDTVTTISLFSDNLAGTLPAEIANLKKAGIIDFNNNAIVALPEDIWQMTTLDTIDFGGNQLTLSIPIAVGRLTNLRALLLDGNNIYGTLPSELFTLTSLEEISFSSNVLTGTLPSSIGMIKNSRLKYLILGANKLVGTIHTEVSLLKNLETLYLAENSLSGTIPSDVGLLTYLETLDLSFNRLVGKIPSSFGNLTRVKTILLYNNQLTGSVPFEICRLRETGSLQVLKVDQEVTCGCCNSTSVVGQR